jgi:hypothetical protein
MNNFLVAGARFAPAVDYSQPPANLDTSIVQSTSPIVNYCFVLSIDRTNNKTYKVIEYCLCLISRILQHKSALDKKLHYY